MLFDSTSHSSKLLQGLQKANRHPPDYSILSCNFLILKMDPLVSPADVSVQVSVASDSPVEKPSFATERRVTPSWTVTQLKIKLETMTGIPPGSQRLMLKSPGREHQWMDGEEKVISQWGIAKGCEIEVYRITTLEFCLACFWILPPMQVWPGQVCSNSVLDP